MKAINSIHNTMAAVITVLFMTLLGMGAAGRIAAVETGGQADRQARILSAEDAVRLLGRFCPDTPPAVLREAA
ncbi:MAG: hypothetical protein JW810_08100, partial [Sedimentisphaerales bacterium]|nr:hypothetical protein [Sedimentisphaerales bacterium]